MKMSGTPEDNNPTSDDYVWIRDTTSGALKRSSITNLVKALNLSFYPVGSVYANYSNTANPATLLGFGVWTAMPGRMLIGVDSSDADFATGGNTGGEKMVSLNGTQNGPHGHGVYDPGHSHGNTRDPLVTTGTGNQRLQLNGTGQQAAWSQGTLGAGSGTGIAIYDSGNGIPHNNMPPYTAVYLWRRTA